MRDLELLTENQIHLNDILEVIKANFKVGSYCEEEIYVEKTPNSMEIWFENGRMFSDCEFETDLFEEKDKGKIPI